MKGKIPTGQRMTADLYLFSEASGSRRGSATPLKTNMTMEKQPFQDVSPTKHCDFPASHVSFRGSIGWWHDGWWPSMTWTAWCILMHPQSIFSRLILFQVKFISVQKLPGKKSLKDFFKKTSRWEADEWPKAGPPTCWEVILAMFIAPPERIETPKIPRFKFRNKFVWFKSWNLYRKSLAAGLRLPRYVILLETWWDFANSLPPSCQLRMASKKPYGDWNKAGREPPHVLWLKAVALFIYFGFNVNL